MWCFELYGPSYVAEGRLPVSMFEGMWHVSLRCSVMDERCVNEVRGKGWLQETVRDENVTIKQTGDVSVWSGFGD